MAVDIEKRNKRQNNWIKAKDRINFVMPKGMKEEINEVAEKNGVSAAEYIRGAILEKMQREGYKSKFA